MTYYKSLLGFNSYRWQDLSMFAMKISSMLYSSTTFEGQPYTKVEFDAVVTKHLTKGVAAINGTAFQIQEREDAGEELKYILRESANYVNMISKGERSKILLSGFEVSSSVSHSGKAVFSIKQSEFSGQVDLSWGKVYNASSYAVRYSLNEDGKREEYTQVDGTGSTDVQLVI